MLSCLSLGGADPSIYTLVSASDFPGIAAVLLGLHWRVNAPPVRLRVALLDLDSRLHGRVSYLSGAPLGKVPWPLGCKNVEVLHGLSLYSGRRA